MKVPGGYAPYSRHVLHAVAASGLETFAYEKKRKIRDSLSLPELQEHEYA